MNQQSSSDGDSQLLSARQAAALLDVKPATLYAYVSRGLLHSFPSSSGRGHRYARTDVLRLKARAEARSGHGPVAASALDFGEPVLESALTQINPAGQRYRGQSAVELARRDTPFEAVAELLWSSSLPSVPPQWSAKPPQTGEMASLRKLIPAGTAPLSTLSLLVPALAVRDAGRFASPSEIEKDRARKLIRLLGAGLALTGEKADARAREKSELARFRLALEQPSLAASILVALQRALAPSAIRAVNQALVLMADHELNMSTFAARIAASAGADLYACISAALATVSGPRHGGACDRVEALIAEAERAGDAGQVVRERLRRGEAVPGFGHPLYVDGDPRTAPMLEAAQSLPDRKNRLRPFLAVLAAMREAGHPAPTVDLGLCALTAVLGLPSGSASSLFAVGRSAGWVAHVLEQRQNPIGLRPRARYSGPEQRAK